MRSTVLVSMVVLVAVAALVVQARKHEGEWKHLHHGKHDHHHHHGKDKYMENGKKEKHAKTVKNVVDKSKESEQDPEHLRNSVTTEAKKKGKEKSKQEAYQQDQSKFTKAGDIKNKRYKGVKEEPKEGKDAHAVPGETVKESSKESVPQKEVPQVKSKAKNEKQAKQKQVKKSKEETGKIAKMAKEEKMKSKLQKPKPTEQDVPVEKPQQAPVAPSVNATVDESLAGNAVAGTEVENNLSCKTNADCPHGWCCQSKKGSCQEFKTAVGQKCWDECMCEEGAICYLEHQSGTTVKGGKGQLGICKKPEPDDLTMGEYLKMQ